MQLLKIQKAMILAHDFLASARKVEIQINSNTLSPKETGALRRDSLDLTRALAEMRKP